MLKPGDQMEIDPRNPPTFVIDEGITLEVCDEPYVGSYYLTYPADR